MEVFLPHLIIKNKNLVHHLLSNTGNKNEDTRNDKERGLQKG
jgi:hypothetical protein